MKKSNYIVMCPNNIKDYLEHNSEKKSDLEILKTYLYVDKIIKGLTYRLNKKNVKLKASEKIATPISNKWFSKNLKSGYKSIIKQLHSKYVFKYPYTVKKKPFSYCLNDVTIKSGLVCLEVPFKEYKQKIFMDNYKKDIKKIPNKVNKKYRYLTKFFVNGKLTIDWKEAMKDLFQQYKETNKDMSKYLINSQKILNMHNGDFKFSHNEKTDGRLHNEFVRIKKEYRKYIKYDNKVLVEIDFSNSIPYILSTILIDKYTKYRTRNKKRIDKILTTYMSTKSAESPIYKEIQEFHKLSATGGLYEDLMDEFKKNYNKIKEWVLEFVDKQRHHYRSIPYYEEIIFSSTKSEFRKFVKKEFLSMLFSQNTTYKVMEMIFEGKFPQIMKLIRELKKGNHKAFANYLFQHESHLVLNILAKEFNKKNRGKVFIATIHDCLITTEDHSDDLLNFCQNRLKELFEYPPNLKRKVWN